MVIDNACVYRTGVTKILN